MPRLGVALAPLVLGAYVATLCPTVPGGDGGEFIAVAYRLGVAHPPGYPLCTPSWHTPSPICQAARSPGVSISLRPSSEPAPRWLRS
jgi:hypothetical protein